MAALQIAADVFRQDSWLLGEGPSWFNHQFWWVDIESGLFLSADATGHLLERHSFGERIGSAAPIDPNNFVVALENGVAHLDLLSKRSTSLAELNPPAKESRFNDGKCDPAGRFLVGTLSMCDDEGTSALYILEKGRPLRLLKEGITISNGIAWSADGRTLYYIDTPTRSVSAFDYDLAAGEVSGERTILRFSEADGWPDGMSIDGEGRLWIAFWDGGAVRCYRPLTGECEIEVRVPCARPTSCCFGGEDFTKLFITTARIGLSASDLKRQPLAGGLFVCETGTKGMPTDLYRGFSD